MENNSITGYKAFDKGLINRYGKGFKVGESYHIDGDIKYGVKGNGFHFCRNLVDTLRYFDGINKELDICEVIGSGKIREYEDDYYGYYDMYACSNLYIKRIVPREEIINMVNTMNEEELYRFIIGYKLSKEELLNIKKMIKPYQKRLEYAIKYFQKDDDIDG